VRAREADPARSPRVRVAYASAYIWRGAFADGSASSARLEEWPGRALAGRLQLRIVLRRATVSALRSASSRGAYRRDAWTGAHYLDRGEGYDWPESRTRLAPFAAWLRGAL